VLEGRGGADTLLGGVKADAASYLHSPAGVKVSLANPVANTGDAEGDSYTSMENLIGSRFADELTGDGNANGLTGEAGPDVLTGGGGNDTFVLHAASDSPPGAGRDRIADLDAGDATTSGDKIDLRAIDAQTGPGNQAFTFIGTAAFTSTKGELRVQSAGSKAVVMGDVNGDGAADFEIELSNFSDLSTLTAIDFRL
jgi:Ca2+-binding RTX toxin-like protein